MFQLTCMAGELARALSLASQVSGREKQVPILRAVRIQVGGGSASISATNLDHAIRATFAAEGGGEIYVETGMLAQKAGVLRAGQPVTLVSDDDKSLTVSQARTRWKVPLLDGAGYPGDFIAPIDGAEPVAATSLALLSAFATARAAIEPGFGHVIYMGALLDMTEGFNVVGTDRHRFAVVRLGGALLPVNVILPNDAMNAIGTIFRDIDDLRLSADDKCMVIEADGILYKTKLAEGQYLPWQQARDSQAKHLNGSLSVDRAAFSEALARAAAISENQGKDAKSLSVHVVATAGECSFTCTNRNGEEGADYCESIGDDGCDVIVSISHLKDMVGTIAGDRMRIDFKVNDEARQTPLKLSADGDMTGNFRFVMPMKG